MIKNVKKVALFDIDDRSILAFHYPTYTMLKLERKYMAPLEKLIINDENPESIAESTHVPIEEVKWIEQNIPPEFFCTDIFDVTENLPISQLTFLVSTACNLRCKYCYADKGTYNYKPMNMGINVVEKTIDFFHRYYYNIKSILFFGGEPMLNYSSMEKAVKKFDSLKKKGEIESVPCYSMITNGTLLDDKMIDFIKENDISVTISLDGNRTINDKLRVFPDGRGTFGVITKNIRELKTRVPGATLAYECTFTKVHENMGLTIEDIINDIRKETGLVYGQIVPAISTNGDTSFDPDIERGKGEYDRLVEKQWEEIVSGKPITDQDILQRLGSFANKHIGRFMCAMGFYAFTIAPNGDIYPCHMLTDGRNPEYLIGNVSDDWESLRKNIDRMSQKLKIYDKAQNEKCKNCFAVGFCGFCPALHILDNDFKVTEQYQDTCERIKRQTERFLIEMTKIRTDSKKWSNLLKGMNSSLSPEMKAC
jgi:uncharacterized protein